MAHRLKFSVVVTAEGNVQDSARWEESISSAAAVFDTALGYAEITAPGDSEETYHARECGIEGMFAWFLEAFQRTENPEAMAEWAWDRWGESEHRNALWWATLSTYENSGTLGAREFFDLLQNAPVTYEDCETLGTLGGPLGGIVPDVPFTTESTQLILHMRVTPFLERSDGEFSPLTEASWDRLRPLYDDPWAATN